MPEASKTTPRRPRRARTSPAVRPARARPSKAVVRPLHCGLSPVEWTALWESQDRRCFICRKVLRNPFRDTPGQQANVDHCHVIEKTAGLRASIRGLLCGYPCNRYLWRYWTSERLSRAAVYVETLPAQVILARHTPSPEYANAPGVPTVDVAIED